MTTVTFAPGSGHDNYFNCFANNLDMTIPEGVIC